MIDDLDFWLVWREGGVVPAFKHDSRDGATTEASHLSRANRGTPFFVLKPISSHTENAQSGLTVDEANELRSSVAELKRQLDTARREKHKAILALEKKRDGLRDGATAAAAEGRWSDTSLFSARADALNEAVDELEEIPF